MKRFLSGLMSGKYVNIFLFLKFYFNIKKLKLLKKIIIINNFKQKHIFKVFSNMWLAFPNNIYIYIYIYIYK